MTDEARAGEPRTEAGRQMALDVSLVAGFEDAASYWQQRIAMVEREAAAAPSLDVERLAGWLKEDYAAEAATSGGNPFSTRRPHEFVATRLLSRLSEKAP